jgi:D-proline reductase (dithiol) PrdB
MAAGTSIHSAAGVQDAPKPCIGRSRLQPVRAEAVAGEAARVPVGTSVGASAGEVAGVSAQLREKTIKGENQIVTEEPIVRMTLDQFFTSLHHGERSNERFGYWQYYFHLKGDHETADFLDDVLRAVGDSVDDGRWERLVHTIRDWDQTYADWFIDDFFWTQQVRNETATLTPLAKPLAEARIALVTSGGFHKAEDEPYGPGDTPEEQARHQHAFLERHPTLRVIPKDYPRDKIRVSHPSYDQSAVRKDINVLFPLDRLLELEKEGVVGELADENVSYMGVVKNIKAIGEELMPAIADVLRGQSVDAAVLSPGCPGCHLTISQVARGLEEAGIPTVVNYLDIYRRWAMERLMMPRVVFSPFFLGRLFGAPFDVERQRQMVEHCVSLLADAAEPGATASPALEWRSSPAHGMSVVHPGRLSTREEQTMKFLSEEWFQAAQAAIDANAEIKEAAATTSMRIQQVATDPPGGGEIKHFMYIDNGTVTVGLGEIESPEVSLSASYETAAAINRGDLNAMTAMAGNRVRIIDGNIMSVIQNQRAVQALSEAYESLDGETEY